MFCFLRRLASRFKGLDQPLSPFSASGKCFRTSCCPTVDETGVLVFLEVQFYVSKLMKQREPEVVQPIVPERQRDHRFSGRQHHRRSIQVRTWQMAKYDQVDSLLAKKLSGEQGPRIQVAELY